MQYARLEKIGVFAVGISAAAAYWWYNQSPPPHVSKSPYDEPFLGEWVTVQR